MELLILGLIVLSIYVFIRLMSNFSAWMTGARYRAYRQLASRYHGRYETRGLSDPPTVSFTHNGATRPGGPGADDHGTARPDSAHPRRRAVQQRHTVSHGTGAGQPPCPSPATARELAPSWRATRNSICGFVVRANDIEMARDFLCPPVRRTVASLQQVVHPGGMLVSINPERMLVQIDRNLGFERGIPLLGCQESPFPCTTACWMG